jgi:hypothetical protein
MGGTECGSERVEIGFERGRCVRRSGRASWPARSDQTVGIRKLSERGSRASFRSAPHRTMWRACRAARARCFEHTPRRECCQRRSNLDHRANARSSGAQAGSTPAGRAERTVEAQRRAFDAAEHRMKIHPRWASDLPATRRRDVTPDRPRHHRVICSGRPAANRDESRAGLSRAFGIGS